MNNEPLTVREVLGRSSFYLAKADVPSSRLEAELLVGHVLALDRTQLYVHYEQPVDPPELDHLRSLLLARAKDRVPTSYLIGCKSFLGLGLHVPRGVFIPRPETEELAVLAVERLLRIVEGHHPELLDLCTGSGALSVAIAKRFPTASLLAIDVSPAAVETARINVERHQLAGRVTVREGDLWDAVHPNRTFTAIVANPPYIPTGCLNDLQAEIQHEPRLALDGGPDGLDLCRRILSGAFNHLMPAGIIVMEHGEDQGAALCALAARCGLVNAETVCDLSGRSRFLVAERPV